LTAIDPETGDVLKRDRLKKGGKRFFASPVAADNKVFIVDTAGRLTVVRAGADWDVLASNSLGEPCFATPAICNGRIYLRTSSTLYCFGNID
jgi:hypothetical protein